MILPLALYGHPALRTPASLVDAETTELKQLIKDMWATMYRTDGIGLAAPQVGQPLQLFVVDLDVYKDEHPELKGFKKVFINPRIESMSAKKLAFVEGCLSLPGIHKKVRRPESIRITYQDETFKHYTEEYDGLAARVIQHEYDHLYGRLFVDHLHVFQRYLLRGRLNKIASGQLATPYRVLSASDGAL